MKRQQINEIATLVEKHWAKHPNIDLDSEVKSRIFLEEILLKYNLTDSDWEEVLQECNRRTETKQRKLWFSKRIIDPFLTIFSYMVITYTSLFLILSMSVVYELPSKTLFPNETYPQWGPVVNGANLLTVLLGLFLVYWYADRRRSR